MGYSTDFDGRFNFNRPLTNEEAAYLSAFSETRRMKRITKVAEGMSDPIRMDIGLPIGKEAEYFVGGGGSFGQDRDASILEFNDPPSTQPGLWCQWVPTKDKKGLEWNGTEKFYNFTEWLRYIIENFLTSWGLVLNGVVKWQGEDFNDRGKIMVKNNKVSTKTLE